MQRATAIFVLVCLSTSTLAQTAAPPPPAVVVLAYPVQPEQEELASAFEARFAMALHQVGVPRPNLDELFRDDSAPSLARGDQLFEQGRRLFDNLDCARAARRFADAAEVYGRQPAHVAPATLARAHLFLGACKLLDDNRSAALEAFGRAVLADKGLAPDPELFGKDVLDAWTEAGKAVEARERARLEVDAQPVGARVTVRGEEVGRAPVPPLDVPVGSLLVQVTRPGYRAYGLLAELAAGRPNGVVATLEQLPAYAAIRELAAPLASEESFKATTLPPEAAAIADRLGARYLAIARVERGVARTQVWDVTTGNRLKGLDVELRERDWSPSEEAAVAVRDWVKNPAPADVGSSRTAANLVKQWWFWTAIGGAAVVTAGVVYVATRPRP